MQDLDSAELEEFKAFFKKYYGPNNATLVVAGDINIGETIKMIKDYFGSIPKGPEVERVSVTEDPIESKKVVTEYDSNIQIPLKAFVYRTPSMKDREAYVLNMISDVLSGGKTSRLYKRMVDDDKIALQVLAFARSMEDYGTYLIAALPLGDNSLEKLATVMDEEIEKLKTELISEKEYQKLQNTFENRFVSSNSSVQGIASSLATYHVLYGDVSLINNEIEIYRSITREEIKDVANKYLQEGKRLEMDYLPENEK
jgi:predicted Zn-dependent peptidase